MSSSKVELPQDLFGSQRSSDTMAVVSISFFRSHWTLWRILGVTHQRVQRKHLYLIYSLIVQLTVTIGYPLHLGISTLRNGDLVDDIKNLTTFATCLACSVKFMLYAYNFKKVGQIENLLKLLDMRVKSESELKIYNQLTVQLRNILIVFISIYLPVGISAELMFIFQEGRSLMYPAWFPLDWRNSTLNYIIANIYQFVGISYLIMQNYVNDCFPAVVLCIISAHIKMLYIRFEEVGLQSTDNEDAQRQLEACITDHKRLLELFDIIESFMSLPMLMQLAVSGLNVCISTAAVLFFVEEPMGKAYFVFYGLGMPLQIFPICYYATDTEFWFGKLHYAAFSCNWIDQDSRFKRKLMLFVERSLKQTTAMAGGMIRIHVNTFFSVLKFSYSLFTIITRMRK